MLMSLFSIFDPYNDSFVSNWFIFCLIYFCNKKIFLFNNLKIFLSKILFLVSGEMKIILKNFYLFKFFVPLFFFILIFNLMGLLPFTFPVTSHMSLTFTMSLPLWLSLFISSLSNVNKFLAHVVPYGCPFVLMFLMVLIETVSMVIRPLTLAIRLSANIIAGHIIMILISMSAYMGLLSFLVSLAVEMVISLLEMGVAFIQPYVFFILLTLYSVEI